MSQPVAELDFQADMPVEWCSEEPRPCLTFDEIASNHRLRLRLPAWGWLEQEWEGHPAGLLAVRDGDRVFLFYGYRRQDPDLFAIA